MPSKELLAALLWDDNATFESNLYLCNFNLIWLRFAELFSIKIEDLQVKISSSKSLLKVKIEYNMSHRETWAILTIKVSMYINANY